MKCLSQNDVGGHCPRNQDDEEVYAEKENWQLEKMESIGFETLRVCKSEKTVVITEGSQAVQN